MRNFTNIVLSLAMAFGLLGGVNSVSAETRDFKTPIKLTGATNSPTIVPIAPSTLENLYAATFTPTADFSNIFQYKNLDVRDYEKIVIKFGSPVSGNWNINKPDGTFSQIPANSEELVIDVSTYGSYGDFTIFNWAGERTPITISEVYFSVSYEVVNSTDWSSIDAYSMWHGTIPDGGSLAASDADDALKVVNPSALDQNYKFQYEVASGITTVVDEDYLVAITLKSTVAGNITCAFGGWSGKDQSKDFAVEVGDEWVTKEVKFSTFPYALSSEAHVLLQSGKLAGTILIQKVEVFKVPELNPIAKPDRTATDAKTDVFAGFKTIGDGATWDAGTRAFTKVCGWQWEEDGIDLSQYRYLVITAGKNWNTDGAGAAWDAGWVSIKDKNNLTIEKDGYGADHMNMWFSQWNNHNCLCIDLEKLRREQWFDIYHIKELKINGDIGFILGNVYASNQKPNNDKNWGDEDNGDHKVEGLPADKFGTICLPWQAAVAGAYVYQIVSASASGIGISQYNGLLEAGKPYFFKSNEALNGAATSNVYFYKATAAEEASPIANNGLIGTFSAIKAPLNSYVLSNNKLYKVDSDVTVGANKAYVDISKISSSPAPGVVELDFNEPTGIETVANNQELNANSKFFNLAGQRVAQPTKGLYIVNGKKVLVK